MTSLALVVSFLATVAQLGTHVLLATLGGMMGEKAGNLNLGIEGMMLFGAALGFRTALTTGSPLLAIVASGLAGMSLAAVYAFVTVTLRSNQVVTGLAISILGGGLSKIVGVSVAGMSLAPSVAKAFGPMPIPLLNKLPVLGPVLFSGSPFVPMALLLALLLHLFYRRTRPGLAARLVGEMPAAADASGIPVSAVKYANLLAGGFLCGLGGGYFCLVYAGRWQNGITAGAGWIAVALIIFSTWRPLRAIAGAYLFGAVRGLAFVLQSGVRAFGRTLHVAPALLDMLPYLVTVLVLVLLTRSRQPENRPPAALGVPYFREER